MKKIYFFLMSFLILATPVLSQEIKTPEATTPTTPNTSDIKTVEKKEELAPEDFTTPAFLDEVEMFRNEQKNIETTLSKLNKTETLKNSFIEQEKNLTEQKSLFEKKKKLSGWGLNQAKQFKQSATFLFEKSEAIKKRYLDSLAKIENFIQDMTKKRLLFDEFYKIVRADSSLASQRSPLAKDIQSINSYIKNAKDLRATYLKLYQEQNKTLKSTNDFQKQLQAEIDYYTKSRLTKTAPAFYEAAFRNSFSNDIYAELKKQWQEDLSFKSELFKKQQGQLLHIFLLFLFLSFVCFRLKKYIGGHFLDRPVVFAFATAMVAGSFYIENTFELQRILFWISLFTALSLLIKNISDNIENQKEIFTLLFIYSCTEIVNILNLPIPFYRLFLVILASFIAVYCYRIMKISKNKNAFFNLILQTLIIVFAGAIFVECLGYHLLSSLVIHGAIKSAFLIFVAWNLHYYFLNISSAILNFNFLKKFKVIKNNRYFIYRKIKLVFYVFIILSAILGLATIWGIFETIGQAWQNILNFGITFDTIKITLFNVLQASFFIFTAYIISFLGKKVLETEIYPRNNINSGTGKSINTLLSYFVWIIGFLLAFAALGFEFGKITIIAGALSVGIGFGLQNIVNNFVSGLMLLFERPIKAGDVVEINGESGTIEKVGLRSTIIRSFAKTQIIIPNSDFITQKLTNLTHTDSDYRIFIPIGVAYGSPAELVKSTLLDLTKSIPEIQQDPAPEVFFMNFGESSLNFELRIRVSDVSLKLKTTSDTNFAIEKEFRKNNIEIPFPQRDLHLRSIDTQTMESLKDVFNKV